MSLYFQPSPDRSNDDLLPTAPDAGVDVRALIDELTNRINEATRKIEHKVDAKALAKVILTDRDIVLMGDQVSIVGQLNIVDWIRDMSGNPTGGIDPASMTRITGGKIQTGVIESFNWSVMAGSQINLDNGTIVLGGSVAPKFSVTSTGQLTCQDATVTGTLTAGSFIQSSVKLDDEFGISLGDLAAGTDVQAALNAGVTNILAGIGSNFRLNVDTANAVVTFQHKDAVFLGTAVAGSNKPGLGISSSGIGIGYNRASDGAWVTSIAVDASGNAAFLGTVTAGSIVSGSVTVNGVTMSSIAQMAAEGFNISESLTTSGTTILRGVLQPSNTGALAIGSITWNSTTGALTGGTGIAVTEWGIIGASGGTATFSIQASNGAAIYKGDITGGSNINITGQAIFGGNVSVGGSVYSASFNAAENSTGGVHADAGVGGIAVRGSATGSGSSSIGVSGVNSTGIGVHAEATTGIALDVEGRMFIDNSILVANLNCGWFNSKLASAYCQGSNTNSGLCVVSGNVMNIQVAGTLASSVRTRASANAVIIENISDERLKQDIEDEVLGLDFINSLQPRSFRMRENPKLRCHGLIYQEVAELFDFDDDSLASLNEPDGMGAVDYNGMFSPMILAMQQLYKRVKILEGKNA